MRKENLKKKLDELEVIHQVLISEYVSIDQILRAIGFSGGMVSLKEVAKELLKNDQSINSEK